jgi:predicted nucleotidyltransferase
MLTPAVPKSVAPLRREEVIAVLRGRVQDLRRFGVRSLELFGSLARDEAHAASDVDVLVEFDDGPTFDQFMDLKFFLEDLLARRVDLVTRAALKPRMRPVVEREAVRVA